MHLRVDLVVQGLAPLTLAGPGEALPDQPCLDELLAGRLHVGRLAQHAADLAPDLAGVELRQPVLPEVLCQ